METVKVDSGYGEIDIELYDEKRCTDILLYTLQVIRRKDNYFLKDIQEYFNKICMFWKLFVVAKVDVKHKALQIFTQEFEHYLFWETYDDAGYTGTLIRFDALQDANYAIDKVLLVLQ